MCQPDYRQFSGLLKWLVGSFVPRFYFIFVAFVECERCGTSMCCVARGWLCTGRRADFCVDLISRSIVKVIFA